MESTPPTTSPVQPTTITMPRPLPSFKLLLKESWQRLVGAIKPLAVLVAVSWAPMLLVLPLLLPAGHTLPFAIIIGLIIALIVLQVAVQAVAAAGQVYALGTIPAPGYLAALKHGLRRALPYFGHGLALTALALGCLLLVILPPGMVALHAGIRDADISALASGGMAAALAVSTVLALLAFYLFFRLTFVLALAALGEGGGTFRASWQLTRGYVWGIFWRLAAVGIVALAAAVVSQSIAALAAPADEKTAAVFETVVAIVTQTPISLFATAALVVLLRHRQQRAGAAAT